MYGCRARFATGFWHLGDISGKSGERANQTTTPSSKKSCLGTIVQNRLQRLHNALSPLVLFGYPFAVRGGPLCTQGWLTPALVLFAAMIPAPKGFVVCE
jgi:hypothetical protein